MCVRRRQHHRGHYGLSFPAFTRSGVRIRAETCLYYVYNARGYYLYAPTVCTHYRSRKRTYLRIRTRRCVYAGTRRTSWARQAGAAQRRELRPPARARERRPQPPPMATRWCAFQQMPSAPAIVGHGRCAPAQPGQRRWPWTWSRSRRLGLRKEKPRGQARCGQLRGSTRPGERER